MADIVFQPDPNTAYIMDEIIRQYLNIKSTEDTFVALSEFVTGLYDTTHTLDACFGFNNISSMYSQEDLVLGQGIYRLNANPIASVFPLNSSYHVHAYAYTNYIYYVTNTFVEPQNYMTEFPISVQELLSPQVLQNVYMFASVYFYPNENDESNKIKLAYIAIDTVPISLIKDIDLDAVKQIIYDDSLPGTASIPNGDLELFKVIIDIDYFSGVVGDKNNNIHVYTIDKRKSRGWAGFAEENLATYLIPTLIKYRNKVFTAIDTNIKETALEDGISALVDAWKSLSWPGGFDVFWDNGSTTGDYVLPSHISDYIYG